MRGRFALVFVCAALAGHLACAGARAQHKKYRPPCSGYEHDAPKYADCMDTRELNHSFVLVLGRHPTAAEFELWKKAPPVKYGPRPGEGR